MDGEETKKKIEQKAAQLFVQKGYGAVTMNEVCAAAGVSKGSLYHHFPSKDELFLDVVEKDTEQWLQEWNDKQKEIADLELRFYAFAEHCSNDLQNPLIRAAEEFSRIKVHSEEIQERLSHIYASSLQACRGLIQEGMDTNYFTNGDVEDYVIIVTGMLEGMGKVTEMSMRRMAPEEVKRYYREAVRLLLQGIRAV